MSKGTKILLHIAAGAMWLGIILFSMAVTEIIAVCAIVLISTGFTLLIWLRSRNDFEKEGIWDD